MRERDLGVGRRKRAGWFGWAILLWLLTSLLVACGDTTATTLTLPTPQTQAGIVAVAGSTGEATATAAGPTATPVIVSLPGLPTVTITPPTTATAQLAATTTPTLQPSPTVVPTPTAFPSPTANPQSTPTPTPLPTITPRPTANLTPVQVDGAAELTVIKAAYDALVNHFYTSLDLGPVSQKALEEAARELGLAAPPSLAWGSDNAANWTLFEEQFNRLVGQTKLQLPPGGLAHGVVGVIAIAVGDAHTYFLDQKRSDTIARMERGDNSTLGFGASFVAYENGYWVQRLVTGSPAQQAGLQVGDRLAQFDGVTINATTFSRLSQAEEGHSYAFGIVRSGQATPITLNIPFRRYTVPTAEWRIVGGHVGFISLNAFQLDVTTRLDQAIADLRGHGADSLVVDLRFNGGGYNFDRVAGRFVTDGTLLGNFTNRGGTTPVKARSNGQFVTPPLPLVVLVDYGSASASEIFSLAVQENRVGELIGGKTRGAIGTVRYWPLGDGTNLAVTDSVYTTAKGEKLNGVGITPDMTVVRSTADILAGRDPQLDAAIKYLESKVKP